MRSSLVSQYKSPQGVEAGLVIDLTESAPRGRYSTTCYCMGGLLQGDETEREMYSQA